MHDNKLGTKRRCNLLHYIYFISCSISLSRIARSLCSLHSSKHLTYGPVVKVGPVPGYFPCASVVHCTEKGRERWMYVTHCILLFSHLLLLLVFPPSLGTQPFHYCILQFLPETPSVSLSWHAFDAFHHIATTVAGSCFAIAWQHGVDSVL